MTRNTAREIAMHLAFELSFTDLPIGEFLNQYLSEEKFAELAPECELYAQRPNAKQEEYIRRLVSGVAEHAAELDTYIEKYAKGGSSVSRWWPPPLCGWPCMRSCTCRISPTASPSTRQWS